MDTSNNQPGAPVQGSQQSVNLQPGTILVSEKRSYKVAGELGAGGYGVTYLAKGKVRVENVTVEATFAIKELFPCEFSRRVGQAVVPDPDRVAEFARSKADFILEATRLQNISTGHENIVRVNEIFEANGTAYYVMQHIDGQTIYDYIGQNGPVTAAKAMEMLLPVFDAIEYLHQNRINHFDIKPDNIMLQRTDEGVNPILIDFGLSIHFKQNGDKTTPKSFFGLSEGYAPIEQYAEIKDFSPASDVYSLAATLVFMLTGEAPAPAPALRIQELRNRLSGVAPDHVAEAICRAMAKSDDQRTPTVNRFREELTAPPAPVAAPVAAAAQPAGVRRPVNPRHTYNPLLTDEAKDYIHQTKGMMEAPQQPRSQFQPGGMAATQPIVSGQPTVIGTPVAQPPGQPQMGGFPGGMPPGRPVPPPAPQVGKRSSSLMIILIAAGLLLIGGCAAAYFLLRGDDNGEVTDKQREEVVTDSVAMPQVVTEEILAEEPAPADAEEEAATPAASVELPSGGGTAASGGGGKVDTPASSGGKTPAAKPEPKVTNGTLTLRNGTYTGQILNGKPHGKGKVVFTAEGKVDPAVAEWAQPGYSMDATYSNGQLEYGRLYDASGNLLKTIIP